MRKWALIAAIVGLLAVPATASAAPSGLRDPFDPLLTVDTGDGTTTDGTPTADTDTDDTTTTTDPAPAPSDDGLPTTGRDAMDWLVLAYVLVALGGGLLAVSRVARPARKRLSV